MHDGLISLALGLQQLLTWPTPAYLFAGVVIGFVVGVLPGIGGPAALAMILTAVIPLAPIDGLVLLTAVAAVSASAGDLTAILIGVPGESTAAAIVADGHAMSRRGEGGRATGAAVMASLIGALIGAAVMVLSVPIARPLVSRIQSPEVAALAILGLGLLVPLSRSHPLQGLAAGCLGLALATIGLDPSLGIPRFTFGQLSLWDGVGLLPIALGMYAIPEALETIRARRVPQEAPPATVTVMAGVRDALEQLWLVCRCSLLGVGIGILPGVGASVSQWIAYAHAGQRTKGAHAIGNGAIEGVIGPAAATTATLGGAMVPTLALGIPGSVTTTFLLGGLIFKGLIPGPALLRPEHEGGHLTLMFSLMWSIVLASAIGSLLAVASVGWIARIASTNLPRLFPVVLTLVLVATIGERHTMADLAIVAPLGVIGYTMSVINWPRAPFILGFVLGPLMERRLLLSTDVYGWAWLVRPGVLLLAAGALLVALFAVRARGAARGAPQRSRGRTLFGGALAAVGVAGLWASQSLPLRAALVPRLTFGALLALAGCYVIMSIAKGRSEEASGATGPHAVRLAWFALFASSALVLGLVPGATLCTVLYLHFELRQSPKAIVAIAVVLAAVAEVLVANVLHIVDDGRIVSWFAR